MILSDEDATTKIINGWKKLNTLAHYGVKESAVMSLVPRKLTNCTLTNGHCKSSYRNCKHSKIASGWLYRSGKMMIDLTFLQA